MLRECEWLSPETRFTEAARKLSTDPRFGAVETSRERERLFYEYIDEVEDKLHAQRKIKKKEDLQSFREVCNPQSLDDYHPI